MADWDTALLTALAIFAIGISPLGQALFGFDLHFPLIGMLMRLAGFERPRPEHTGSGALIGKLAVIKVKFAPCGESAGYGGKVFIAGELWQAHGLVKQLLAQETGSKVRVVAVNGLQLEVEPLPRGRSA